MPHRLPRSARLALGAVKVALVGCMAVAGWATDTGADNPDPGISGYAGYPVDDKPDRLQQVLDQHNCSITGFGDGQQPVSAIVRSAAGHLRFVGFETGWQVFTRHGAATLVAVCLDEPPAGQEP